MNNDAPTATSIACAANYNDREIDYIPHASTVESCLTTKEVHCCAQSQNVGEDCTKNRASTDGQRSDDRNLMNLGHRPLACLDNRHGAQLRQLHKAGIELAARGRDEIDRITGVLRATHPDFTYQLIAEPEELGNGGRVPLVAGRPGDAPAYA